MKYCPDGVRHPAAKAEIRPTGGVTLGTYGGGAGSRILDTEVLNIRDDGMFMQGLQDLEIGHCRVWNVNQNWKPPYTSQKEAGGDAIQLSQCDRWHVHHNALDRTNSGNKFCFIATGDQTQGVFEQNRLTGPLTSGDGGASVYLGCVWGPTLSSATIRSWGLLPARSTITPRI